MRLFVLLALIASSNGAKLDRTYLPPNAQASGGSDVILQTPVSGPIVVDDQVEVQEQIPGTSVTGDAIAIQRPIVANVVTDSPALQRPITTVIDAGRPVINDVVRIGNRGNIFVQAPGPQYQVIEQRPERTQAALERNAAILRQELKNEGDAYAYAYETENGIYGEENGVATNGVNAQGAYSYVGDDGIQYTMRYSADENGFRPEGDHIPTPPPIPEEILLSLEQNARDEAAGIYDDGSYDELKYGGPDAKPGLGVINVVAPAVTRPIITPVINPVVNDEDTVVITNSAVLPEYRAPVYRHPVLVVSRPNDLVPIVNNAVQDVTPSTVNKAYLPPVNRVVLEDRSSKVGKPVFGNRNRQPKYNVKDGYKY